MNMTVRNESIRVGDIQIGGVGSSSVVLIGDTEVITSSSVFDTPASSLVYSPKIPLTSEEIRGK
jgi:spore germination protein PD